MQQFPSVKGQWQQNFVLPTVVKLTNCIPNFIFLHAKYLCI